MPQTKPIRHATEVGGLMVRHCSMTSDEVPAEGELRSSQMSVANRDVAWVGSVKSELLSRFI